VTRSLRALIRFKQDFPFVLAEHSSLLRRRCLAHVDAVDAVLFAQAN
jgi:hypothetical protein